MGRFFTKKMLIVLTSILLLHLLISSSYAVENLSTYGEADKDCLDLFGLLECSIYHPYFRIHSGSLRICASFCERVFEACSDAYFSSDIINQVIVPCGSSEGIICGKASKWVSNGTEFCNAVGYTVQEADDSIEEPCYEIKSSLEPMVSDDSVEELFHESKSSIEPMVSDDSVEEEPCHGCKSSLEPMVSGDSVEELFHGSKSSIEPMVSDDSVEEEPCFEIKSSLEPMVSDDSVEEEPCFEIKSSLEPMVSDDSVEEEPCVEIKSSIEPMVSEDSVEEETCYGSKSSLEPMVELESIIKTEKFAWFQDFQKRVKTMTLGHKISWVVTVFVMGINIFYRWCYMQQMLAMIERNAED